MEIVKSLRRPGAGPAARLGIVLRELAFRDAGFDFGSAFPWESPNSLALSGKPSTGRATASFASFLLWSSAASVA